MKKFYAIALLSAISIDPYGDLGSLLQKDSPWRAFRDDGPVLTSILSEWIPSENCEGYLNALLEDRRGIVPIKQEASSSAENWGPWTPFESKELDAIEGCDNFPCAVKADRAEVDTIEKQVKSDRPAGFLQLVFARMGAYLKSGVRKPYEFPGGISDPWALFEKRGLSTLLGRPETSNLGLRVQDFKKSRVRPIRQVLDRRVAESPDHRQATVWIRDVYTDHYFDSWGEWGNIQCYDKKIIATFALSMELDLLKKTDFISSLAKGSMRDSVRRLSFEYMDNWWAEIRKKAEKR